jgi:uncharacterized membrane protein YeaQ/YmgE (transglycosylase-associated protein family)
MEVDMTIDQLVLWIIVGGIAGLLADVVVRGIGLSLLEAILVGIIGAFLGGWLFGQLGINVGEGVVNTIVAAFVGSVILLFLVRALRRR